MRRLLLTVPAIAAAVMVGACGSPTATTTTPTTTTPTTPATKAGPAKSSGTKETKSGGSGGGETVKTPFCRTSDLDAVVTWQPQGDSARTHRGLVTLTNKTSKTCTVDGWAAISLVNAADEVAPVKTSRVNQPGKPVRSTLKPGRSAWAGIKWTACDKADNSCAAGNTLRFNLEASTDGDVAQLEGFPDPAKSDITMKSLQIGSLQPSNQGVVAW